MRKRHIRTQKETERDRKRECEREGESEQRARDRVCEYMYACVREKERKKT